MGMSQLMVVQPLLDAGKGSNTNSSNKNAEAANPFQSLLQGKIEAHNDKNIEVQATSNQGVNQQKTVSSNNENQQKTESKANEGEETSQVAKAQEEATEEAKTEVTDDATILAQIMASAVGAQIVPVEPTPKNVTAEIADEKSFLVSDETIVIDSKATLKNDGENLATARDGADLAREVDVAAYESIQAKVTQASQEDAFSNVKAEVQSPVSMTSSSMAPSTQPTEVVINATTDLSVAEIQQPQGVSAQPQVAMAQPVPVNQTLVNANPVEARITQQLGTPEWSQAIGQRVVWMVGQSQQSASLTLSPPELGPIRVVVNLSNNNANTSFYSSNPEVRTALEGTLPRLKELMEEAGIQLGQAHVGSEDQRNNAQAEAFQVRNVQASSTGGSESEVEGVRATQEVVKTTAKGLVDTFV